MSGKLKLAPVRFRVSFLLLFFPILLPRPAFCFEGAQTLLRELHWAVTEEKFELALERLRAEKGRKGRSAVVLIHGVFFNSRLFNLEEGQGLARYLAEQGFDVWNLSLRGTGRSLNPLRGTPKGWNLDDMAARDLAAVFGYVQKATGGSRIIPVGHGAGGLLLYAYVEKRGGSGLAALVTVGAPATFDHAQQEPMKRLLRLEGNPTLKKLFLFLNAPFFGRLLVPLVPKLARAFYNPDNMEQDTTAGFLEEALAEINPGVLDHLLLVIRRGEFVSAQGDFSYRRNLAKIELPILLIGGEADMLAPPDAIRAVHRGVGSTDRAIRIFGPRAKDSAAYGHVDLILGKRVREEVFPAIGRWLNLRDGRE